MTAPPALGATIVAVAAATAVVAAARVLPGTAPAAAQVRRRLRGAGPTSRTIPGAIRDACTAAGWPELARWVPHWAAACAVLVIVTPWVPAGPLIAVSATIGPPGAVWIRRHHRARHVERALPDLLEATASGIRSGRSLASALVDAGTRVPAWRPTVERVSSQVENGVPLVDALATWAADDGAATRLAGAALATAASVGGPGAAALDTTAHSIRQRIDADEAIDGLAVQAMLSARLLTVAPIGFAVVMAGLAPASARFLLATPLGWGCIAGGLALDLAGDRWMRRIVGRAR